MHEEFPNLSRSSVKYYATKYYHEYKRCRNMIYLLLGRKQEKKYQKLFLQIDILFIFLYQFESVV